MNLLFDFGVVLVDLARQRCVDAFAALGFDIVPYLGTYAQKGLFARYERGEVTTAAFCQQLRPACRAGVTDEQIIAAWNSYLTGIPAERLDLLMRLRARYPLFVLSNTNEAHWAMARRDYFSYRGERVDTLFRHTFLSYELGVEKPNPQIFARTIEGIGCAPDEIVFFDDSEVNCAAARAAGMHARLAPAGGAWMEYFTPEGEYIPAP